MSRLQSDDPGEADKAQLTTLTQRVQQELDRTIRARTQSHYGDVEIADVTDEGDILLRFTGFCVACPLRPMTFLGLIAPTLERLDGVRSVRMAGLEVSERAAQRVRSLVSGS